MVDLGNTVLEQAGILGENEQVSRELDQRKPVIAKDELARSERESWWFIDSIPVPIVMLTKTGDVDMVNRHLLEYFGTTIEEIKQWGTNDLIHPDDLSRLKELFTRSIESGTAYESDERLRRSDGVYRWFQARAFPLRDANDQIVRWCVLLMDVDERKRAEAELRRAYDGFAEAQRLSRTGNFIADIVADDHIWSLELYRIFELDPAARINLKMVHDMIHREDVPSFDAGFTRSLGGADFDQIFRIVTLSGNVKHVHAVGRVTERIAGRPLFVGAIQDVSQSKVAEEALNSARSELAHVARVAMLSALTASIAHEINQPLSGIVTNASTGLRMLNGDPPNLDGARETTRRTIRDAKRASDVINRLRAMFSKKEFTLEQLDLNEATREVIALTLSDLQKNRVILVPELADDLPPVKGDRVQLQQVILNLLRNASDAMIGVEDRPRQLLIRTERENGERVRVTVRDAGVGLDRQSMDKLFDAFYTTKSDGMGIGLSVSRSIIERHQGRIWAEPNDGPGVTVSFSIPRHPDSAAGTISGKS